MIAQMIKHVSGPAILALLILASIPVSAQTGKAPCASFQKLPDGKWNVLRPIGFAST